MSDPRYNPPSREEMENWRSKFQGVGADGKSDLEAELDFLLRRLTREYRLSYTLEKEYRFMRNRKFRFDRAYPQIKLAIEVEGGLYNYGRHQRPATYSRDCEKYSWAAIKGWCVVRVTKDMLRDGRAEELICAALEREDGGWKH